MLLIETAQISGQIDTFKSSLEEFAIKHKNDIRKNAEFRNHFQQMCARIGVDPLACENTLPNLFISLSFSYLLILRTFPSCLFPLSYPPPPLFFPHIFS